MNRTLICPHCGEYLIESMVKGGEFECLECGRVIKDGEDYELHSELDNQEDYLDYLFTQGHFEEVDGWLKPRG